MDFTNKIVSEEYILECLVLTACMKAARGIDPAECAATVRQEAVAGILVPYIEEME